MWPNQSETVELLAGARQGSTDAVNDLLDRHRDSLHKMVVSRLNQGVARRVDASDIVQETLLVASRRLADYLRDPRIPFHAWLRQLARDRLVDMYRHELADRRNIAREKFIEVQGSSINPLAQLSDRQATPAERLLRQEFEQRFHAAIDHLDEDAKDVVLMRHAEQLTNSQVAELLGLSEAAAGMRYLRALRQLKSLLGNKSSVW